eukprot:1535919-Rhodomonas_salina.1
MQLEQKVADAENKRREVSRRSALRFWTALLPFMLATPLILEEMLWALLPFIPAESRCRRTRPLTCEAMILTFVVGGAQEEKKRAILEGKLRHAENTIKQQVRSPISNAAMSFG